MIHSPITVVASASFPDPYTARMPSVFLTTLGCAKNQVDSEKVEVMLTDAGYTFVDKAGEADVVIVNTCAFIDEAREESVETILDVMAQKPENARSVVIGCMAQRFGIDVERALPEVDAVVGLDHYSDLVPALSAMTGWQSVTLRKRRPTMDILHGVHRPTPRAPYAYVKAAEGCDKTCAFCAIPLIRGPQRSRRSSEIRQEIHGLVEAGVSEVVLVAQDLAAYGRDVGIPGITELIRCVSDVDELRRLRLLYLYPREIHPELIEEMTSNPKVAPYFDLSLQHSSRELLRRMNRVGGSDRYAELIASIRRSSPKAALRSSFIVGFPGETDTQVEELGVFLSEVRLDWAGFFAYSAEPGTPAAALSGRVPRDEVESRLRYLQKIQDEVTATTNLNMVGERVEVLVDDVEGGVPVGRSYREAPEIDGMINLDRGNPGDWLSVKITAAFGPDLQGRVLG